MDWATFRAIFSQTHLVTLFLGTYIQVKEYIPCPFPIAFLAVDLHFTTMSTFLDYVLVLANRSDDPKLQRQLCKNLQFNK
jgi:hypothetical protein